MVGAKIRWARSERAARCRKEGVDVLRILRRVRGGSGCLSSTLASWSCVIWTGRWQSVEENQSILSGKEDCVGRKQACRYPLQNDYLEQSIAYIDNDSKKARCTNRPFHLNPNCPCCLVWHARELCYRGAREVALKSNCPKRAACTDNCGFVLAVRNKLSVR